MNNAKLLAVLEKINNNAIIDYNLTNEERAAIRAAVEALKNDIRTAANKANGAANIDKVLKHVLKENAKNHRDFISGCWLDSGYKYFTNSYYVVEAPAALDGPTLENPPRLGRAQFEENAKASGEVEDLPTLAELKAELKTRTESAKIGGYKKPSLRYTTKSGASFNVEYLIKAIEATGSNVIKVIKHTAPALITGTNARCLICPIYAPDASAGYAIF